MDGKLKNRILAWIEETMKESGFAEMVIDLDANEKGEGFAADVIFAQVTDKDDPNKKVHLVVKMGKDSESMREKVPSMREIYKRELYIYNKVFPKFREFESEKNIANPFDSYPKCYKTFLTDNMEVVIMENLKESGFQLHDKRKPMNLQHIRLVLKNYAKLHALSFALRDQNQDKFNKLTANYTSNMKGFTFSKGQRVQNSLRKSGRNDLVAKYEEEIKRCKDINIDDVIRDESVITHGDCHNNNFLFKYKDNDKENPHLLSIIDWQVSSLLSPVLDLSCFLYFSSGESLSQLDELLKFYHAQLTKSLGELGSDVEKLFPYSTLLKHWRKYSPYAFILTTSLLHMLFVDEENAPSFENAKDRSEMDRMVEDIVLKDDGPYRERISSIVEHHCNFKASLNV